MRSLKPMLLASALAATSLVPASPALAETRLKVVASFSIIGDFAANVGGDRIELTTLVGPDGDAHVYEPGPKDAAALARADVILVNGLHFEGFVQRLAESSAPTAPVVELTKGVQPIEVDEHDHHEEGHHDQAEAGYEDGAGEEAHADEAHGGHEHGVDPHAFQSIPNARIYVTNIADAFCAADPQGCETYRANATNYDAKLAEADTKIRAEIAAIPQERRTVIASHDAFGYLAREYGIVFHAPEGISTEAEASAADVAALIRQVREDKASAIFLENISNARLIDQISRETGLEVGGTLYSDALSPSGGPAATYIDLMLHNVRTIAAAITGG